MFVLADNLTTTDPAVFGAVTAGDRRWLENQVRRLIATGVDGLDVNASSLGVGEAQVLDWMVEVIEAVADVPLALDSPNRHVVLDTARGRRRAPVLNSWPLDAAIDDTLLERLARSGTRLVVQLREGSRLPVGSDDRRRWADAALERFDRAGVDRTALLIDAVALPWGDDLEAGRGLLRFLAAFTHDHPDVPALVGLGNLGHGTADPVGMQARWLPILLEAGLGAVLLDPLQPRLRRVWSTRSGPQGA